MERHLSFGSKRAQLIGALDLPECDARGVGGGPSLGLVLLHGWAGYRIGAHQMFVKLARSAAGRGTPCLRFDFRGRGDSEGAVAATCLSTMIEDAVAAAKVLRAEAGVEQVVFVGDCSGSEVAIGAGTLTEGCRALVLWSAPIVGASREASDRAKRQHILRQYAGKLLRRETWSKLFSGRLQGGMIRKAITGGGKGAGEEGSAADRKIDWLGRFAQVPGDMLFIYGDKDPTTADSVAHYQRLTGERGRPWHLHLVAGANHAFYSCEWEREVIEQTLAWVEALPAAEAQRGDA